MTNEENSAMTNRHDNIYGLIEELEKLDSYEQISQHFERLLKQGYDKKILMDVIKERAGFYK